MTKLITLTLLAVLTCRIFSWVVDTRGGDIVRAEMDKWVRDKKIVSVTQSSNGAWTTVTIIAEEAT